MDYVVNTYRFKKFGKKYFVTTDHGSYCILSEDEFRSFRQHRLDQSLQDKLEQKELILTHHNFNEAVRLTRERNSFLFSGTSLHIIVVTLRCNMSCVYCHANSRPAGQKQFDMNKETAAKTVDFIFQSPSQHLSIEFQGGEPLLNWEIVKHVVEYAKAKSKEHGKSLTLTVVTNLSPMDDEKMEYLLNNDVIICTSLDGPKELHDSNRKGTASSNYDQVAYWIKRLNQEYEKKGKSIRVQALVTLTRQSLRFPKEIVDTYLNLRLKVLHLRFLNNLGLAKHSWESIGYSAEEYLDFWHKAVHCLESLHGEGKDIRERMVVLMSNKIASESDPSYLDLRSPCGAAIGQLAYNYNGDIYTCDEARMIGEELFMLGNVSNSEYKDVVTCDKACAVVNASINDQYICNTCVYKPYCGVCPVCNYAEQGSVIGKISQTDRCKIFKAQFDWVVRQKFINPDSKR
jgi:His-Xaa-Ser system radical SAM maturase HxsB